MEAYREDPSAFTGRPKIPGYQDKTKGRFLLTYEKKALGKRAFKRTGKLVPSGLPIEIATQITWEAIRQVRIVPRADGYMQESHTPSQRERHRLRSIPSTLAP